MQKGPAAACGACLTAVNGAENGFGAFCPGDPAAAGQPRLIEKRDGVDCRAFRPDMIIIPHFDCRFFDNLRIFC